MSPVSDPGRAAARIRGCLKTRGEIVAGGVVLWTEEGCGEWKADARELSEDLTLLSVAQRARKSVNIRTSVPAARGRSTSAVSRCNH